jgi:hypothetical protein
MILEQLCHSLTQESWLNRAVSHQMHSDTKGLENTEKGKSVVMESVAMNLMKMERKSVFTKSFRTTNALNVHTKSQDLEHTLIVAP